MLPAQTVREYTAPRHHLSSARVTDLAGRSPTHAVIATTPAAAAAAVLPSMVHFVDRTLNPSNSGVG